MYLGSEIVNISLEPWLIILVFFGSFLLSVIKKYSDKVTDIGNLKIKHDILVINTTIFLISIIYVMHLVDVSVFNLFNSVISTIFFLLSLVLLRLGVKEINKSVDTIYILINDYRFVVSLIIWFVHYYFYRYFFKMIINQNIVKSQLKFFELESENIEEIAKKLSVRIQSTKNIYKYLLLGFFLFLYVVRILFFIPSTLFYYYIFKLFSVLPSPFNLVTKLVRGYIVGLF